VAFLSLLFFLTFSTSGVQARSKDKVSYGEGLIVNVPAPESEVEQVVAEVAQNGVIRGTKEYNKDQYIAGAKAADSSSVFPPWDQGGKIFYKVRLEAIDPLNFKETNDVGTVVVRYIVQPQGEKNSVLHIDALFQEDFRRVVHPSNGSVEIAEYKDIREHLDAIELMQRQNIQAEQERQERLARKQNADTSNAMSSSVSDSVTGPSTSDSPVSEQSTAPSASTHSNGNPATLAPSSPEQPSSASTSPNVPGESLEDRIKDLRKQVQRVVKSPGAPLKSAPFHTAGTLQLLSTGTEVLILISTPYWYGVETHEGQHGWMLRDELETP
jgi:hypothetical protein